MLWRDGKLAAHVVLGKLGDVLGRPLGQVVSNAAGDEDLAQALSKNVFNGEAMENARILAAYVREASERLAAADDAAIRKGAWTFPKPAAALPGGVS